MIKCWDDFKLYLKSDLKNNQVRNVFLSFIFNPVVRFTVLLRLNEYLFNSNKYSFFRIIFYIWFRMLGVRLGFSVPLNVFGPGLAIVHYGLLVVSGEAVIGANCRIHAGVNIGASAGFKKAGDVGCYAPKIGDNCYIGPGAKIFGPIKIGSNCVIGANAVVSKSFIQDDVTIAGVPARIISCKNSKGMIFNE